MLPSPSGTSFTEYHIRNGMCWLALTRKALTSLSTRRDLHHFCIKIASTRLRKQGADCPSAKKAWTLAIPVLKAALQRSVQPSLQLQKADSQRALLVWTLASVAAAPGLQALLCFHAGNPALGHAQGVLCLLLRLQLLCQAFCSWGPSLQHIISILRAHGWLSGT